MALPSAAMFAFWLCWPLEVASFRAGELATPMSLHPLQGWGDLSVSSSDSDLDDSEDDGDDVESDDSNDDDVFLRSAFATNRRRMDQDGAIEQDANDFRYSTRVGAVHVNGKSFDVHSKDEALDMARSAAAARKSAARESEKAAVEETPVVPTLAAKQPETPKPSRPGSFDPNLVRTYMFGSPDTPEQYRRFFKFKPVGPISPWHDISLFTEKPPSQGVWMVTEIPKGARERQRMSTSDRMNPLRLPVTEDGKASKFDMPSFWNRGFLPQTWLDPEQTDTEWRLPGSNGPVEVIEVGKTEHVRGQVTRVRILGVLPMVVGKALHWRVLAVAVDDPMASELAPAKGVDAWNWNLVQRLNKWFNELATEEGSILNLLPQEEALNVVRAAHQSWRKLRSGEIKARGVWAGSRKFLQKTRGRPAPKRFQRRQRQSDAQQLGTQQSQQNGFDQQEDGKPKASKPQRSKQQQHRRQQQQRRQRQKKREKRADPIAQSDTDGLAIAGVTDRRTTSA